MKRKLFLLTLTCVFLSLQNSLWGQCPDPPVAICDDQIILTLSPTTGEATLFAETIDDGSYPVNCGDNLDYRVNLLGQTSSPPDDISITFDTPGEYDVVLWVIDDGGNFNACFTDVTVQGSSAGCDPDITPPLTACYDQLQVDLEEDGTFELFPSDIDANSYDNCSDVTLLIRLSGDTGPFQTSLIFTDIGDYVVELQATDEAGNSNICWGTIIVNPTSCDGDTTPPTAICKATHTATILPFSTWVLVHADEIDDGSFDDCSSYVNLEINLLGETTEPPNNILADKIAFDTPGEYTAVLWAIDPNGNWNSCTTIITIEGSCDEDTFEPVAVCEQALVVGLGDDGEVTIFPSDIDEGSFDLCTDITLTIGLIEDDYIEFPTGTEITFDNIGNYFALLGVEDEAGNQNMCFTEVTVVQEECPYLTVDMTAPFLRRCFSNFYVVNYCNFGTVLAEDAYIEVTLDPFLEYLSSTIPFTSENNGVYRFDLGDLEGGECGFFKIYFEVSCDAELGQTHCSDAIIYPNDLCNDNYTGPVISVQGSCDLDNDQVIFTITNEGQEAMPVPLNYLVVEDVIMYVEEEPFQLGIAESVDITLPANGSTYRLEAEQPSGYPWFNKVADAVEGCVNGDEFSMGMITQFSPFEAGDFISIDCQENIGSYDPNDKQANPKGVGEDHLLPKNTPIDYKIRFQNTGTDTAFLVVVLDTLSEHLDPQTIVPGASSHPYEFQIRDNVIEFTFDNIMLPDSSVNEEASNGFVQFSIKQMPDLEDGIEITNTAAIYFDFNEPIITNEVFHIIGQPVIVSLTEVDSDKVVEVKAFPNPFRESTQIQLPNINGGNYQIFSTQGQLIKQAIFQGHQIELQGDVFHESGIYFIQIVTTEGKILQGKLVIE